LPEPVVKNKRFLILLALAALLALLFAQAVSQDSAAPQVTFTSLKGEKISMQSLRGKVVLVNFWATSCVGCIHEMPQIIDTYRKYNTRGLETIAVAMSYDPPNYVVNYTEKMRCLSKWRWMCTEASHRLLATCSSPQPLLSSTSAATSSSAFSASRISPSCTG